jgi:hypothetical protein
MALDDWLHWLEATDVATAVRENEVLFPWIESVHVLAIVLVIGTISIVDLRLLGLASRDRAVSRLIREVLPYTWGAFLVAALTGSLLFCSNAMTYGHNFFFRGKLVLLVLAPVRRPPYRPVERRAAAALEREDDRRGLARAVDLGGRVRPLDRLHLALISANPLACRSDARGPQ